ncbi:uncharacterized protein LACBIDRAFT_314087 [Laccaria bicolor S238N-H82]|uniref:Predicted protein n=1 Tax=Laccaria bicolor (strain S238N-H82 / ATCC MYA-4686) TaxID=486041 RepID=B0D1K1_LACBS|nr:uncharacterized protein LACBIDRAFT_314087 [Laccaria bicolor S238N-H82]EDR11652.1 predicted protein [Laccaria bicolor S238N-H82]|eukprot:XP_001877549.1 predicted protein [Laccaria bicolor S238N-H82]
MTRKLYQLEEKKKIDQLRKEKEEDELQRLQEEQTGKKRTEKLEWLYAMPATGSISQNPNDLEKYLLGKKRYRQPTRTQREGMPHEDE